MAATEPNSHLPVSVLTGPLGSGKTTLLAALVRQPRFARTGIVINEFGEAGIDHLLVERVDERTVLLESGCVCCTLRSDLAEVLRDISMRTAAGQLPKLDRIVVETTGLADPAPILHTLMNDPVVTSGYRLERVITTLDAVNGAVALERHETRQQVATADVIVMTKVDLVDAEPAELTARVRALNPAAELTRATHGELEFATIFSGGYDSLRRGTRNAAMWIGAADKIGEHGGDRSATAHTHDDIVSFVLRTPIRLSLPSVSRFLEQLARDHGDSLLRLKGLVAIRENGRPLVIHAVRHLLHPPVQLRTWPSDDHDTRLVLIVDAPIRKQVETAFARLIAAENP